MTSINSYHSTPPRSAHASTIMPPQPSQPHPLFFISRSNGTLVPLIAVDELPFSVRLQGVPRVLTFERTYALKNVGLVPYTGMVYKLESDLTVPHHLINHAQASSHSRSGSNTPTMQSLGPDYYARQALAAQAALTGITNAAQPHRLSAEAPKPHETALSWRKLDTTGSIDKTQAMIDAILTSGGSAVEAVRASLQPNPTLAPPSGTLPDQEKKQFCTYWIRTGECDYTQQGCLYKHEMPDRATLESIGFRGVPRWWQERHSAFRLTGERETVGPLVKPSMWLKSCTDDDSDSESNSAESTTEVDSTSISSDEKPAVTIRTRSQPKPNGKVLQTKPATVEKPVPKAVVESEKTGLQAQIEMSKLSIAGGDLIDFAPLLPTPASSVSTPSLSPSSSATSSLRERQRKPAAPSPPSTVDRKAEVKNKPTANAVTQRGSSTESFTVETTKRNNARQYARRGAPVSIVGPVQSIDEQIQELQRAKRGLTQRGVGLSASQHAPRGHGREEVDRRNSKTACRPRRPAASAPNALPAVLKRPVSVAVTTKPVVSAKVVADK